MSKKDYQNNVFVKPAQRYILYWINSLLYFVSISCVFLCKNAISSTIFLHGITLKLISSEDDALYEAAKTLFYKSSDEEIRMRCLDREEYYADLRNYERAIEEQKKEHEQELAQAREQYEAQIRQLRSEIASLKQPWSQRTGIPLSVVFPAFLLPLFPLLRRTPADYF